MGRTAYTFPDFLDRDVKLAAKEQGALPTTLVVSIVAHGLGYQKALRDGTYKVARGEETIEIEGAVELLWRAREVPIRFDGIYTEAEIASFLGVDQAALQGWQSKGLVRYHRSDRHGGAFIRGSELLELLTHQAYLTIKVFNLGIGAPDVRGSAPALEPAEG